MRRFSNSRDAIPESIRRVVKRFIMSIRLTWLLTWHTTNWLFIFVVIYAWETIPAQQSLHVLWHLIERFRCLPASMTCETKVLFTGEGLEDFNGIVKLWVLIKSTVYLLVSFNNICCRLPKDSVHFSSTSTRRKQTWHGAL